MNTSQITDLHLFDIVDDLLENDLLGLLLSVNHFQRYCKIKAKTVGIEYTSALLTMAACPAASSKFQYDAIKTFNGLHIAECSIGSPTELAKHLNEKLKQFSSRDFTPESYAKLSDDIENAWKYRRACIGAKA